jgi:hypothetical protein
MLALAHKGGSDAALPAFQDARLALPLALNLRLQTRLVRLGEVLSVCRNRRVGMKNSGQGGVRFGVVTIRHTENSVKQAPMPAAEGVQHGCLTSFFPGVLAEISFLETIIASKLSICQDCFMETLCWKHLLY